MALVYTENISLHSILKPKLFETIFLLCNILSKKMLTYIRPVFPSSTHLTHLPLTSGTVRFQFLISLAIHVEKAKALEEVFMEVFSTKILITVAAPYPLTMVLNYKLKYFLANNGIYNAEWINSYTPSSRYSLNSKDFVVYNSVINSLSRIIHPFAYFFLRIFILYNLKIFHEFP